MLLQDVSSRVGYNDSLRKKKREEAHSKFRKLIPKCENADYDRKMAKDLIRNLRNDKDFSVQIEAARKIREHSIDNYQMVEYSLKLGLLEAIKENLLQSTSRELQHEGVWICANISIENAKEILDSGIHLALMKLMMTTELAEGCLWAITNATSENIEIRDKLLADGVLYHITTLSYQEIPLKVHQQNTSVLLNFAKFNGLSKEIVLQLLALINKYLESDDFETVYNSLCTITFLIMNEMNIKSIVCSGTIPVLVRVLNSKNVVCERMAANLLKKLADSIDENCLIDVLSAMPKALKNQRAKAITDILRFITTIAETEGMELWKKIIENEELLVEIIDFVKYGNACVVESAMELLYLLVSCGEYEENKRLVNKGLLESLCNILKEDQKLDILKVALATMQNMLEKAGGYLDFMQFLIEECGGKDNLDILVLHYDETIADIADFIISKYFPNDDDSYFHSPNGGFTF